MTPGKRFREALRQEKPLQVVGTINAYAAILARDSGFKAIYLSGAGVANSSYGIPDLGLTTLDNVIEDAGRITAAVDLPLLVDIDTGWGGALMIARAIKSMIRAGVAAVHIEDQMFHKRCGHRPGKAIVSQQEMCDRIKAAVDSRTNADFVVMARTDALASEGLEAAIERSLAYKEAGADMLFPEACTELEHYQAFHEAVGIPILANITEFGKTPLFTTEQLDGVGVDIALYPLSANRAMSKAALGVYNDIRVNGSQKDSIQNMQTREELYSCLDYHSYEEKIDRLFTIK
ncbi:MAG: methylisocitrate lyase [Chlamydiales bacterium]|jgi:methylisocitrate lyase